MTLKPTAFVPSTVKVLFAPLIVLFVSVSAPVSVAIPAAAKDVAPVPPLAIGKAVPLYAIAKVPDVVTGPPLTDRNDGTVASTDVTVPVPPAVALTVWFGHEPVMVTLVPATSAGVAVPVPPLATGSKPVTLVVRLANVVEVVPVPPLAIGKVPVTPVVNGKPVAFVSVAEVGVPSTGVTSVGDVDNTTSPVPVVL